jgi:hypothetical protein
MPVTEEMKQEKIEEELFEKRAKKIKVLPKGVYMIDPDDIVAQIQTHVDDVQVIDDFPEKLKKQMDKNTKKYYVLVGYEAHNAIILDKQPPRLGNLTDSRMMQYSTYKINVPYKCTLVFALNH